MKFFTLAGCFLLTLTAGLSGAEPLPVVVFGDSITAGNYLPKEAKESGWVRVVQRELGDGWRLVNEGKGGRPTASLDEFDAMLQRQADCSLLVITLGINDSRDISGDCVAKAVQNVAKMIKRARSRYAADLPVLLAGPPNINRDALGPTKNIGTERDANLRELNRAFEQLARESNCEYISLYGVIPPASLTKDGVHPDADGNAAIAALMVKKINQVIQ